MTNLFKKAAVFTDIHFGLKSNSITHNEDCTNFVKWAVAKAKEEGCETCLFLGDWHHNRASINILTLNYSLRALEHLNENFDNVYFIPGNHDLYYRDKRDIQSVEWAKHLSRIHICNDWITAGDVTIAPWLVAEDHKKIKRVKTKYLFGHFELPHFLMNAMVEMPVTGEIQREDFANVEQVYSGHFHLRQSHNNITYIGNCFPHNYSDAGDDSRGMMILEWGKDPKFHAWTEQPKYRVFKLSDVIEEPEKWFKPNMHVRVNLDIDINYEESNFIKETFIKDFQLRELTLIPNKSIDVGGDTPAGQLSFQSVDQIVTAQIMDIKSDHFDNSLLLEIYNGL